MTELYLDARQSGELLLSDRDPANIAGRLAGLGVRYEHFELPTVAFDPLAERDEVIGHYLDALNALTQTMPSVTLDVTSVLPEHPRLNTLQRELMTEHAHDLPEAQIMVWGRGRLFMRASAQVWALCCEAGDFVHLPSEIDHWFEMDASLGFRTVRLFDGDCTPRHIRRGRDMRGAYPPLQAQSVELAH